MSKDYTIFAIESLVVPSVYDATALQQKNACRHSYNLVIQLLWRKQNWQLKKFLRIFSYWILLLATFLIKGDSLAVSYESLIGKQISHRWQGVYGKRKWYKGHASAYVVQIRKQLTCSYNVAKYNGEHLNLSLNLLDNIDKVTYKFLTEFYTPNCKWL